MRVAILFLSVLLCSCGPFIDVNHGIVSTGFLSDVDGFSGSMKTKAGSVTWSVVGYKGTSVANTAIGAWGAAKAIQGTVNTVRSNNKLSAIQGHQGVQNNAINHTQLVPNADGSSSLITPQIPK